MCYEISTRVAMSSVVERASLRPTRATDDASCLLSLVLCVVCRTRRPTARTRRCAVLRHAMPCAFVWRLHDAANIPTSFIMASAHASPGRNAMNPMLSVCDLTRHWSCHRMSRRRHEGFMNPVVMDHPTRPLRTSSLVCRVLPERERKRVRVERGAPHQPYVTTTQPRAEQRTRLPPRHVVQAGMQNACHRCQRRNGCNRRETASV